MLKMNYVKKVLLKLAHFLLRLKWRLTRPVTTGARIIVVENHKILLVKHNYQNQYFLPGGGVKSGETFEQAARRELKEEAGLEADDLKLFGVYNNFHEYKSDAIVVFHCSEYIKGNSRDTEIESTGFFDLTHLPENISPGTRRRIKEYLEGLNILSGTRTRRDSHIYYGWW